jgi:rSAM/selenodomain-associated transferase 2
MSAAFTATFNEGYEWAVIMGSDCPELNGRIVSVAFSKLADADVVLGPAADGGYYLIGLKAPRPGLFEGIEWGSGSVFASTTSAARNLNLSVATLETLRDVDRPEDLEYFAGWKAAMGRRTGLAEVSAQNRGRQAPSTISVIIPALNEEERIEAAVASARVEEETEVIVVDGGSSDSTVAVADAAGARVLAGEAHRGRQMNVGARVAGGDILLFLHADTILPPDYAQAVTGALTDEGVAIGAFTLALDGDSALNRVTEAAVRLRCRVSSLPYGDQALFLRSDTFQEVGGFADMPLMEDFELVRRMRSRGRVVVLPQRAVSSSRRMERLGVIRSTLINLSIVLAYHLGVSPDRLARWYRGETAGGRA